MRELEDILSDEKVEDEAEIEGTEEVEETEEATEVEAEKPADPVEVEEDPRDKELAGLKAALHETRSDLRAFKAQQSQPPVEQAPLPDVIDDPQGFSNHVDSSVAAQVYKQKLDTSRFLAVEKFGQDVVDEAYAYFSDKPAETSAFGDHPSPFHAAVQAYQRIKVANEIGDDPDGWKERERAAIRAELKAEQDAKQVAENVTRVGNAPSLATQPNLGSRGGSEWSGPTPLENLLG